MDRQSPSIDSAIDKIVVAINTIYMGGLGVLILIVRSKVVVTLTVSWSVWPINDSGQR